MLCSCTNAVYSCKKVDLFQLLSFACAIGLKLQDPRVKEAIEGKVLIGL